MFNVKTMGFNIQDIRKSNSELSERLSVLIQTQKQEQEDIDDEKLKQIEEKKEQKPIKKKLFGLINIK